MSSTQYTTRAKNKLTYYNINTYQPIRRTAMTFEKAVKQLNNTRILSTDLLKPLNISFESFLKLGQMSQDQRDAAVERLIKKLNACK